MSESPRDRIAELVMVELVKQFSPTRRGVPHLIAVTAYEVADAMLAQRIKPQGDSDAED